MQEAKRNTLESAEEILARALKKNVKTIGFGGKEEMYEALELLKREADISSVDEVKLTSERGTETKRVERVLGERPELREPLSEEEAHLLAYTLLSHCAYRERTESGYAGYDTMVSARRALLSPILDKSTVSMVGERTGTPYEEDGEGNRKLEQ